MWRPDSSKPPSHSCVEIDFLFGVYQDIIAQSESEDSSPVITAEVSFATVH